ncbi:hypothetical protein MMC18_008145 [Xylographa bjoerkii]|nr:hypothetical protein [Xylographa bjoerkii]
MRCCLFVLLGLAIQQSYAAVFPRYETVNGNISVPQNNAPLNETLAYYKLPAFNGVQDTLTHGFFQTSCGSNLSFHYTDPLVYGNQTGTASRPVMILTHGYPESSYIWRRMTQPLSERVPLIVPDQPGYGLSTPCITGSDKLTFAGAIMEAVQSVYGQNTTVVLAGHDRGARTMHRAAVSIDKFPGITALGVFLADIVPFVEEYASFANSTWSVNYFHWAFLPKEAFATDVIMAYGGGAWVKQILTYGSGLNSMGIEIFQADDSWAVYENFFNQLSVTNASVYDYAAGATTDYDMEIADQAAGRKIAIPCHVLYSIYNLGSEFDVPTVWGRWVDASAGLTVEGIGGNKGHFIVEEAPDETIEQINTFLDRLNVAQ